MCGHCGGLMYESSDIGLACRICGRCVITRPAMPADREGVKNDSRTGGMMRFLARLGIQRAEAGR